MQITRLLQFQRRCLVLVLLLLLSGFSLHAQTPSAQAYPKIEVFGGYSYAHNFGFFGVGAGNGWETSADYNFNRWFGIKADVSGHYDHEKKEFLVLGQRLENSNTSNAHEFLLGPQLSFRKNKTSLFAHGLVGGAHESDTFAANGVS